MTWNEARQLIQDKGEENQLLRELDRGIDDMETGREVPLKEAFQKIDELRKNHQKK